MIAPVAVPHAVDRDSLLREVALRTRVLIVAGIPAGVLVVGVGGRFAMFVLRLTSPDNVRGRLSDDGFIIGRFTVGDTYNLLMLGAAVGLVGAMTYLVVRPWLLGPQWLRRGTIIAAGGAVGGAMVIEPDGVDFAILEPTWLAAAMFIAIPALFAWTVGAVYDRVEPADSWTMKRRLRWGLPVLLLVLFPLSVFVLTFLLLELLAGVAIRHAIRDRRPVPVAAHWLLRAGLLAIALLGGFVLVEDLAALR